MLKQSSLASLIHQFKPFIKYCLVGISGTLIDVVFLYIFIEYAHLPLLVATTLAFLFAVTNNFLLNKKWTFKNPSKNYKKLYIKFFIISCVGLLLTNASMYILVKQVGIWYIYSKLLTSLLVLTWNFLGNKYWTFRVSPTKRNIPSKYPLELSIVIPAFNEEERIKKTISSIYEYINKKKLHAEIIIIDDGSVKPLNKNPYFQPLKHKHFSILRLSENKGKGFAIKTGITKARGKLILMMDADNSTPISELEKLTTEAKKGYDIIVGSRYLKNSSIKIDQSFFRKLIGRGGNLLIQVFLINNIKDTQCGFKLFKNEVAQELFRKQKVKRWGFDMEILVIAQQMNYSIKEVPVNWFHTSNSRMRPIRDALKTLFELVFIKLNLISGRYEDN